MNLFNCGEAGLFGSGFCKRTSKKKAWKLLVIDKNLILG